MPTYEIKRHLPKLYSRKHIQCQRSQREPEKYTPRNNMAQIHVITLANVCGGKAVTKDGQYIITV